MKNYKIVDYNNKFNGDEVVVRFETNTKIKYFEKSFPRKGFFKALNKFLGK